MTTKEFPTRDVLSTITGVLMGEIGGVYQVLNWMTGESVYTHQIPRISREAQPVIIALHPELAPAIAEAENVTQDNYTTWRDTWEDRYGLTIAVPKMTIAEHERIDPLSELAEKVSPDRIAARSAVRSAQ
ncbi:hypothetical protein [Mesorhizobium sp. B2-3-2]|uniref:DUF7736 domain-containing protein n=1 Tax=Mesorhizobium sp. B2-3-2 TaxID=2589961 RepID=UPI00112C2F5B|nr:hypothetical protein [Mesorhizobium sp. B2-3-2]TPM37019.1 hypothetical protein FJ964_30245 [Mesorhizobium sp. B2-3-2]